MTSINLLNDTWTVVKSFAMYDPKEYAKIWVSRVKSEASEILETRTCMDIQDIDLRSFAAIESVRRNEALMVNEDFRNAINKMNRIYHAIIETCALACDMEISFGFDGYYERFTLKEVLEGITLGVEQGLLEEHDEDEEFINICTRMNELAHIIQAWYA